MRFTIVAAVLISAQPLVASAFAQSAPRPAPPQIGETKDADIKAEYLEAIPYKPCPANVRFPNGQQMCLGLPGHSFYRRYTPKE
jgi:hypothetical protein